MFVSRQTPNGTPRKLSRLRAFPAWGITAPLNDARERFSKNRLSRHQPRDSRRPVSRALGRSSFFGETLNNRLSDKDLRRNKPDGGIQNKLPDQRAERPLPVEPFCACRRVRSALFALSLCGPDIIPRTSGTCVSPKTSETKTALDDVSGLCSLRDHFTPRS